VTPRLNLEALGRLPAAVRRPDYDFLNLGTGIVHLGIGAFHRAHQAVYTEDAIRLAGGDWGILGVSLRHATVADALAAQNGLYTVETLGLDADYRVVAAIRGSLCALTDGARLQAAIAAPRTHIVTLTVTEKGYCLGPDGALDFSQADIAHDLLHPDEPRSVIAWLVRGLAMRLRTHGAPITVISCDNLQANGAKLCGAVTAFAQRSRPEMLPWLRDNVAFPVTVVNCIVPAATEASRARVSAAIGLEDTACVQRELYSQWVIENRFAGPRPSWDGVGVQIVEDVSHYSQLKLHVLNACHSALAYLGLPRGHSYVREAIADPELAQFLENLVSTEIAPALEDIPVLDYWRTVRPRFLNPRIDHRLSQIAEDGSAKLAERIFPLMIANAGAGIPVRGLSRIVRSWLELAAVGSIKDPYQELLATWSRAGADLQSALDDPMLFPPPIRSNAMLRASIVNAAS
jgi:fructuronate reductase